ncbi:hypothetical protein Tco_0893048 [Tanacetum coccineum]|uniref:Uncharacterized protein n=1 Tax=Tanacetum coccineum TaxID=301880 RepID=A0ABQ5C7V9_9ASTR
MTKTKSFERNSKHKALYHALMKSILADEDAMDKGVSNIQKKRKPDDDDRDEDPPAGPDQWKRRKTGKDTEQSKKAKSTGTSKGTTKSQPKSTSKSAQAEETVFEARDTQVTQDLREDMGNTDEPPIVKADPKDWFKKPKRPPSPDPEWNEGDRYSFDLSKPLPLVQSRNRQIIPVDYFFNNDLAYLQGESTGRTYTTSLTKTKATKRGHYAPGRCITYIIQKRVEDLQLGVESYQKKLNISKPRTRKEDISRRAPYTTLSDPQGVIYEDKLNRKRLMRSDELYKFSDGTLQSVRDTLHDMATNLRMRTSEYLSIHNDDGNPSRANIKQALCYETLSKRFFGILPDHSDEVLKLKNFKKDDYTSFQEQEKYEHVGPKVTSTQDGKRSQDDDSRLCLADDPKEAQIYMQVKLKGTSSSLKSKDHYAYHKLKDKV